MLRILVVENNDGDRMPVEGALADAGYIPVSAKSGDEALDILDHQHIDLIVAGTVMSGMDGYELLHALREAGMEIPVIMIAAKGTQDDKRKGFMLGADDYMVKPVDEEELLWRVSALLRRAKLASRPQLKIGDTELHFESMTVLSGGRKIELPYKEFMLLYQLLSYNNKIFTRRQLMDEIWGLDSDSDTHTVDVHINRLRSKFHDNGDFDIITIRGVGYKAVRTSTEHQQK